MATGKLGEPVAFAMNLLLRIGELHGATRLQKIDAAFVNTTFAPVETHFDFMSSLADSGARVAVPTYTNVTACDRGNLQLRPGRTDHWVIGRSQELNELHRSIGCTMSLTCAPYQLPDMPGIGSQIACSESNAVSYFNSVQGARTLKYGDYADMAAALTGRVPYVGLHTDEGRRGTILFHVETLPEDLASDDLSYHLIGHAMGLKAGMNLPVLTGINPRATVDNLRSLGACGASSGGVAMYHAVGLTPEAPDIQTATGGQSGLREDAISVTDILSAKADLTQFDSGRIDAVTVGTPHASLSEVEALVELLDGRRIHADVTFYVQMNRHVMEILRERGSLEILRSAGVSTVVDTCVYWRPSVSGLTGRVMTSSGKFAYYAPGELDIEVAIGSLRECVESATLGKVWRDPELVLT